jgi:hypothetical protein
LSGTVDRRPPGGSSAARSSAEIFGVFRTGTSLMADLQAGRWVVFKHGEIARTISSDETVFRVTAGLVVGADTSGFLLARSHAGASGADSTVLLRVSASTGRVESIAKLGPRRSRTQTRNNAAGAPQAIRISTPLLSIEEQELYFPDGWLAIARLDPYRIDWRNPAGAWIRGAPLPYREISLADNERRAYAEREIALGRNAPPIDAEWARTVPPFLPSVPFAALVAAPDGRLLIARAPTASNPEIRYDIVNRRSLLQGQIVLPYNERIAAIGSRGLYVIATSPEGLEYVRRHSWPPVGYEP